MAFQVANQAPAHLRGADIRDAVGLLDSPVQIKLRLECMHTWPDLLVGVNRATQVRSMQTAVQEQTRKQQCTVASGQGTWAQCAALLCWCTMQSAGTHMVHIMPTNNKKYITCTHHLQLCVAHGVASVVEHRRPWCLLQNEHLVECHVP